jgi:hypothetical protein
MANGGKAFRYTAFGMTVLIGVLGGMFIVGETLTDPGDSTGALVSALWVLPTAVLAVYALIRPKPAVTVLTAVAFAVAAFVIIDQLLDVVPRDEVGPVGAIAVFAVGVALGFLGLHRPARAGGLLLLVGAANVAGVFARMLESDGAVVRHAFGGSSGAAAILVLVLGLLFLRAGWCESRQWVEADARPTGDSREAVHPR